MSIYGSIFTKFDETASSGELLKIPVVSSAPIVFITDGQDFTQHMHIATAEHLAKQMKRCSKISRVYKQNQLMQI